VVIVYVYLIIIIFFEEENESVYVSEIESLSTCSFLYFNKNAARKPNGSGGLKVLRVTIRKGYLH